MDDKQIDLDRRDYTAEPLKGEPIFGANWPIGLALFVSIWVAAFFIDGTTSGRLIAGVLGVVAYGVVASLAHSGR